MFKTHFLSKTHQSKVMKRMDLSELLAICGGEGIRTLESNKDHAFQACAIDHYATPPKSSGKKFIITKNPIKT